MPSPGSDDKEHATATIAASHTLPIARTPTPAAIQGVPNSAHTQDTQPASQPLSPEHLDHCGCAPDDVADIFCILHPTSAAACHAVELTAGAHPGNVLRDHPATDPFDDNVRPTDIALRLSQFDSLIDPSKGWVFGRNPRLADVCIARFDGAGEMEKKISNQHYRIYVNGHGIVMLEDTSTNGTIVEGVMVHSKHKKGASKSRMLTQGSTVQLLMDPTNPINFVVWYPARPADAHAEFETKFRDWVVAGVRAGKIEPPESDCSLENAITRPKSQRAPSYDLKRWEKQDRGAEGAIKIMSVPSANHSFGMTWDGAPKYNVVGKIGKGAFATVYKVATKQAGRIFACKELDKRALGSGKKTEKMINQELRVMERLWHPHIVQFHESHVMPNESRYLYLIMEYVRHGELATYLAEHPDGRLSEPECQTVAYQTLHALHYLHCENITHRDIKPENILIASWEPLRVKLSDFGLSKIVDIAVEQEDHDDFIGMKEKENVAIGGTFLKTFCGTLLYCAPEVYPGFDKWRKKKDYLEAHDETVMTLQQLRAWVVSRRKRPKPRTYDQSVDIWSYAAVIFHLLTGKPPFNPTSGDKNGAMMLRKIMTSDANWKACDDANASIQAKTFLRSVLRKFPEDRPTEYFIMSLEWFRQMRSEIDYYQFIDNAEIAKMDRGEGPKYDADGNELDENGVPVDYSEEEYKIEEEVQKLKAVADERGYTKAALKKYELELKRKEERERRAAERRERREKRRRETGDSYCSDSDSEEESSDLEDSEWERQHKRRRQKSPSLDEFDEDLAARAAAEQNLTTPTKSVKRQRTTEAGGSAVTKRADPEEGRAKGTSPRTPSRQRTNADEEGGEKRRLFPLINTDSMMNRYHHPPTEKTGEEPAHSAPKDNGGEKKPSIPLVLPDPKTDDEAHHSSAPKTGEKPAQTAGEGKALRPSKRPDLSSDFTDDSTSEPTPAASHHAPPGNAANDKITTPKKSTNGAIKPITPPKAVIEDPFTKLPGRTGSVTPSATRTRHFELDDTDKEWFASDPDLGTTTEDEKDVAIHSFGISLEITASLGLKDHEPDRGARTATDERNVFTNGVKIAGKGGIPAISTAYGNQNHNPPRPARRETALQPPLSVPKPRRDRSQRRPPSIRLAEIDPNESEKDDTDPADDNDRTGATNTAATNATAPSHPNPFQKPAFKVPTKMLPPPYAELGKLIPMHVSLTPRSIPLHDRLTSWGRGLNTTVRYPDLYDYRIPKYALEIAFWAPGIESQIERGIAWKTVPGICTILGTRASGTIYVNGVELRKENKRGDARCFGKIYSGDIITIFKDRKCFLAFRCVFFLGEGRMKRPVKERPFQIRES
ncbi:hypothetical protein KEM56_001456, partial [Ascosphaera pollenicola]